MASNTDPCEKSAKKREDFCWECAKDVCSHRRNIKVTDDSDDEMIGITPFEAYISEKKYNSDSYEPEVYTYDGAHLPWKGKAFIVDFMEFAYTIRHGELIWVGKAYIEFETAPWARWEIRRRGDTVPKLVMKFIEKCGPYLLKSAGDYRCGFIEGW